MPKKTKVQLEKVKKSIEITPEVLDITSDAPVQLEAPVLPQELPVEPVKPKVEFLQFSEVELNGKRYKKTFDLKNGTSYLDLIS